MKEIVYTLEEWYAEAVRLFGEDKLKWKFVCPACGHVQAVEDFRQYKDLGATVESSNFNCIGRYAGANKNAGLDGTGKAKGPCNYTSGGLLDLRPVIIRMPDGGSIRSFNFAQLQNETTPQNTTR